ncbi:MAG: hypothetical protein IKB93_02395 [Clostridia bacterium]|nr:hypothetical protein [Clostridia bacterium]
MNDVKEFLILFILFFAAFMIVFAALAIARYTFTKQGKETDALKRAAFLLLFIVFFIIILAAFAVSTGGNRNVKRNLLR